MYKKIRRVSALVKKEFLQSIRDPSCILLAFFLPVLLLFLYGTGISLDSTNLKLGVIVEDKGPIIQSFINALKQSKYFKVEISDDRGPFIEKLTEGSLDGIVIIPSYFTAFLQNPIREAPIQVIADGSSPNTASFVQNYVKGAWMTWVHLARIGEGIRDVPGVRMEPRFWFNQELLSHNFIIPGSIAIIMTLIGTLLTSFVVSREWERGTMEALLATPVTIGEIILSKVLAYFIMGMGSMVLCTFVAITIYEVPFRGSFLLLTLISSIFLLAALGSGLFISTITKNQFAASQAAIVSAYLPAFILSGFIFEISSMPRIIQYFTYLIPARYFVASLQTIFLAGNVFYVLFWNSFALSIFAIVLFTVTWKISRKRLD